MNEQINLRMPTNLMQLASKYVDENGYANIQELIKEALREKLNANISEKKLNFLRNQLQLYEKSKKYTRKDVGF